jgi:hypothetical protein
MGGAYVGLARGHEALAWNPALLGLGDQPAFSIGLPSGDVTATMLGPSWLDMYDVLKLGGDVTDRERRDLLAKIPGSGLELRGNGQIQWAAASVGPIAFSVSSTGLIGGTIGKEFLDLALYARQYGDIDHERLADYRIGNTAVRDAAFTTVSAAYGRSLELAILPFPVSVGVGARYVRGHDLQRGRLYEPRVDLDAQDIEITALSLRARSGSGFGLDFGLAARPLPALTVSFAVENVVQRMTWEANPELRGQTFKGSELSDMDIGDILDRFEPRPFDPTSAPLGAYDLLRELYQESYFPRVVRLGAGYRMGGTALGATLSTTQGKGDLYAGWPRYLGLGVEQRLPLLSFWTVRGGVATSLSGASALTVGSGWKLGPVHLTGALVRTSGHGEEASATDPNRFRFAEGLAAGSGYALRFGIDVTGF